MLDSPNGPNKLPIRIDKQRQSRDTRCMQLDRYPRLTGTALALWVAWTCCSGGLAAAPEEEPSGVASEPTLPKGIEIKFFDKLTVTEDGNYEFIGPVTITWRESRIQADRLTLTQQRYVAAEGNVLVAWSNSHIFGSAMTYDLETEQGVIVEASGQVQGEYLFWAKQAEKIGAERVRLTRARVTSCTQPTPYWSFAVSSAVITLDGYARMWNVVMRGGKVPFFYLPYLIWPVKEDRAIGLLMPEFSTTNNRGQAFSQELFIPIGRSADLTLLGRYYTKAGFGGGGRVALRPQSPRSGLPLRVLYRRQGRPEGAVQCLLQTNPAIQKRLSHGRRHQHGQRLRLL